MRDFDYPQPLEGRMIKSYLLAIEKDARSLRKKLQDTDDLPSWVQAKVVTAQDRLQVANRYMSYKIDRSEKARKNAGAIGPKVGFLVSMLVLGIVLTKYGK
jgi:hypothetical protein